MKTAQVSLTNTVSSGRGFPSRVIFHAVEGLGKTSFANFAPSPYTLMAKGETGLESLIDAKQLPERPHYPEIMSWPELLAVLNLLLAEDHGYKTLVLDTLNGFERLCHEEVCRRDFKGDWTERGFIGYRRGYEVSLADWREFLSLLDELRSKKKMGIIALCHAKIATFKNPEGPDFDRYTPDMHHKTWSLTHKWADIVLFGNFHTVVDDSGNRAKGAGGTERLIYTHRTASYDAKNRHGLPEEIEMGRSGEEAWTNFRTALSVARNGKDGEKNG